MTVKDLTAYLTPDLELPYEDRVYVVKPPSRDDGLKLAAINSIGTSAFSGAIDRCPTCGRSGVADLPESTQQLVESMADTDVAALALGQGVYDQMLADGVPGPHIDRFAIYALYYWVLGEETADAIMAAQHGGDALGEALMGPSTSPRGPRTASANRTQRRASTRRTGASRKR